MNGRLGRFRIAVRRFGPFEAALRASWEEYAAASGCDLRLELVPFELRELHETLLPAGGLARGDWDAALVVTDWLAEAHEAGALADLAPRLRADPPEGYPDAWAPSLLRHQRFGGAVLGLPYHDGPECLVYRTDLLEAAGAEPPRAWDEFHRLARCLSAPAAGRWGAVAAGFPDGHNTVYDFCLQVWSRGGELFDSAGRVRLDGPEALEGLAFLRRLLRDPAAVHPRSREFDSVQSGLAFARGEAAMTVNWFGFAALGETLPESRVRGRIGIAPVPAGPGGAGASLNVYWLLAAAAGSPHPDEAYGFLRHCAGAAPDRRLMLGGGVGCRRSTWGDPDVRRALPFCPALEALHAGARELPRLPAWDRIAAVIDRLATGATDSDEPVAALAARAQREAAALAPGRP